MGSCASSSSSYCHPQQIHAAKRNELSLQKNQKNAEIDDIDDNICQQKEVNNHHEKVTKPPSDLSLDSLEVDFKNREFSPEVIVMGPYKASTHLKSLNLTPAMETSLESRGKFVSVPHVCSIKPKVGKIDRGAVSEPAIKTRLMRQVQVPTELVRIKLQANAW